MPELIPVVTKEEIERMTVSVARTISSDYQGRELVLIGVLKGAFIFLADLARQLTIPVKIAFVRAASYGAGTSSSGDVRLEQPVDLDVTDKDVLIVEDIVDSGLTVQRLIDHIRSMGASSVRVCTMVDKRERRQVPVDIDYACHTVESGFLVGYGLDYAESYRELPGIFHLKL